MTKLKIQFLILLQRIFLPWNITRVLFLFIGISVFYQAVLDNLGIGIVFGLYFMATGLFAWGCAGGNCQVTNNDQVVNSEIEFKEIK